MNLETNGPNSKIETLDSEEFISIDEALSKVSTKPLDRFQKIAIFSMLLGITNFDWFFFNTPYLGKQNDQQCLLPGFEVWINEGVSEECTVDYICSNPEI